MHKITFILPEMDQYINNGWIDSVITTKEPPKQKDSLLSRTPKNLYNKSKRKPFRNMRIMNRGK